MKRTPSLLLVLLSGVATAQPVLFDPSLEVDTVVTGLALPTTMAFLGPNEFLVLEKNTGRVWRILDSVKNPATPVLTLPVETLSERGLLGIAIDTSTNPDRVFIYYTRDADDDGTPEANRIARFEWDSGTLTLINETVLRDLPALPGANHDGGVLALDSAGRLYAMIGDLNRGGNLQNCTAVIVSVCDAAVPDDTSVILRLNQDGTPAAGNPLPFCSNNLAQSCGSDGDCGAGTCNRFYYAYGIRNGFGLAIDPANGAVWNTENGPGDYDEVNRVDPGFNSGWLDFMGPQSAGIRPPHDGTLFVLPGSSYSDPEFSWLDTNAPTGIVLPFGSALGPAYDDVVLVGDSNRSQIYRFKLNAGRTGFDFSAVPALQDLVAADNGEADLVRLGMGFGNVTDLELGPDGNVYVVGLGAGAVYRIRPAAPREFFTLTPCRVVDTRDPPGPFGGPALASGVERAFTLADQCGVPPTAKAVSLNVTVTQPNASGFVTLFPGNLPAPGTSTLNYSIGQTRANNAVVHLSTNGAGQIRALALGSTHLILDVNGYFQ